MGDDRLPPAIMERLRADFSDSILPMKVDLVEWAGLKEGFRRIVEQSGTAIQSAALV